MRARLCEVHVSVPVPVPVRALVCLFANKIPGTGLRHPSSLEEGAGKRRSECGSASNREHVTGFTDLPEPCGWR